jgi:hypothetical protein
MGKAGPTPGKKTLTQDMPAPPPEHLAILALEAAADVLTRLQGTEIAKAMPIALVVQSQLLIAREHLNAVTTGDISDLEDRYVILKRIAQAEYDRIGYTPPHRSARKTGVPDIDHPGRCDMPVAPGCSLGQPDRATLIRTLQLRMMVADQSFVHALREAKLAAMLTRHTHWNFLIDLLFEAVSFVVLGAIVGIYVQAQKSALHRIAENDILVLMSAGVEAAPVSALEQAMIAVPVDALKKSWSMLARSARSSLKDGAHYQPKDTTDRIEFLRAIEFQVLLSGQILRESLASTMSDDELLLMLEAYHPVHTQPVIYEQQVATLLARFEEHDVEGIGSYRTKGADTGRLEVVRFTCHGVERYAEMLSGEYPARDPDAGVVGSPAGIWKTMNGELDREILRKAETQLEGATFVRWIDEDFTDLAVATHHEAIDSPIVTVDVSDGRSSFMPVLMWAAQTRQARQGMSP